MKYLSLFSGIGGFELGIQQAYEERLYNGRTSTREPQTEGELPPQGESIKSKNSPGGNNKLQSDALVSCIGYSEIDKYAIQIYEKHFNHKNYGDITTIDPKELPDFDLIVGGFPCQAFSIAGKRGGFSDTRGTLFFEIARIIKQKQPRLLLLENVKGLLSHDKGKTFFTIISTLDELGYDVQWQVLNSKNHGVPQNRERVFIIGHLRGTPRPQVFPFGGTNGKDIIQINKPKHSNEGGNRQPKIANTVRSSGRGSGYGDKRNWDEYLVDGKIRRLTPIECEGLQGFPDNWTKEGIEGAISDTQRYKALGNAVTVNVIRDIIKKLI